jgi:hypothetical protein
VPEDGVVDANASGQGSLIASETSHRCCGVVRSVTEKFPVLSREREGIHTNCAVLGTMHGGCQVDQTQKKKKNWRNRGWLLTNVEYMYLFKSTNSCRKTLHHNQIP